MDRSYLPPAAAVLIGLGALAAALVAEMGFGLEPCILCLYQRVPYGIVVVLGAFGLLPGAPPDLRWTLTLLCGLVFLGGAGIAGFHVGVEQHWWAGLEACLAGDGGATSVEALKRELMETQRPPCDTVPWSLFGISMAGYNFAASLLLGLGYAALGAGGLIRVRKTRRML